MNDKKKFAKTFTCLILGITKEINIQIGLLSGFNQNKFILFQF